MTHQTCTWYTYEIKQPLLYFRWKSAEINSKNFEHKVLPMNTSITYEYQY